MGIQLSRDEVVGRAACLPAFPRVVSAILATLDDENTSIGALAQHVERDPVITARVFSLANSAALHTRPGAVIRDIATATSMIGMARLREVVLAVSLAEFARNSRISTAFWEHSVAVGMCAQTLAKHVALASDHALVAGLLHDIGQLWMAKFYPLEFQVVRMAATNRTEAINELEREYFGLDHCQIGLILAEHWDLPEAIGLAISHHHDPEPGLAEKLVAATHVAEVFANALDLTGREENQVTGLSAAACSALGIDLNSDLGAIFGALEARSEYACSVFR